MSISHRKFGDLLEEGIKRVHITRKKPIGYVLDEFGYELRPDDSSKGRHALGHWYYKKRVPASMEDVIKLAELVVTNSDVDRDWLSAFLGSAGCSQIEKLCDRFFPKKPEAASKVVLPELGQTEIAGNSHGTIEKEIPPGQGKRSWKWFVITIPILLGMATLLFLIQRQNAKTNSTATHSLQLPVPTVPAVQVTKINTPLEDPTTSSLAATPNNNSFDGRCPSVSSASIFEYSSPQSFRDFLNHGGSFVTLQAEFTALIQKRLDIQDGRVSSMDLTGDGVPEVIVSAILENGSIWQILGCNAGQYESLVDISDSDNRHLRFAVDLNGNKLPEIISYRQTQPESSPLFEFFIQEWNGNQVVDLIDHSRFDDVGKHLPLDIIDWQRTIANATVTSQDTNEDGLYEMIITGGLTTSAPNCETRFERQFTEVWAWNGKSFQLSERVYDLPLYRFQRSADGDLAFALKQFDLALDAYQDVVFDANLLRRDQYPTDLEYCKGIGPAIESTILSNEQEQLTAYARWRILLLNSFTSSMDAMQVVYQTLKEKFPEGSAGYSYTMIATAFWDEYQASQNIQKACDIANSTASELDLYPSHAAVNICFIP